MNKNIVMNKAIGKAQKYFFQPQHSEFIIGIEVNVSLFVFIKTFHIHHSKC